MLQIGKLRYRGRMIHRRSQSKFVKRLGPDHGQSDSQPALFTDCYLLLLS